MLVSDILEAVFKKGDRCCVDESKTSFMSVAVVDSSNKLPLAERQHGICETESAIKLGSVLCRGQ